MTQFQSKYVERIWDIVTDKTATSKYLLAKAKLFDIFKGSGTNGRECGRRIKWKRIKRLITDIEFGDLKPSQLLQKMKNIAIDDTSGKILKTQFLTKCLIQLRIFCYFEETSEKLAKIAEKLAKIVEMNAKSKIYSVNEESDIMIQILEKLLQLEIEVTKLSMQRQLRSDHRSFDWTIH